MKEIAKWAMIPLTLLLYIAYDHYGRPETGAAVSPATPTDAVTVELGQRYRTAFNAAGLAALDAVPASSATTTADLVKAQRDALQAALSNAAAPLDAELTRRLGAFSNNPSPDQLRAFYRDVSIGWRKGAK